MQQTKLLSNYCTRVELKDRCFINIDIVFSCLTYNVCNSNQFQCCVYVLHILSDVCTLWFCCPVIWGNPSLLLSQKWVVFDILISIAIVEHKTFKCADILNFWHKSVIMSNLYMFQSFEIYLSISSHLHISVLKADKLVFKFGDDLRQSL